MRHRLIGLAAGLVLLAGPAAAQVRLLEAGIICPRISTGELVEAPGTEAGHIRRIEEGLGFDLAARTVPTMDNLSFGFRTALKDGAPATDVTIVVTHPPMGPRGVTREEWPDTLFPGQTNLNLFTFELDYEKVPGPWTFAVEVAGRPVVSVPFEVTREGARGPVEAACFQFMS
ncbi:DUF3859 domain-containing protein [Jannaschia ovalis]|uniref:DUF3859 domain-containing protein n=1 Tax=Jannaschia ovalis TaxID=3038773 RepID=A0ABY8LFM9_9RHOB|nr:DUF3859 domain-containing protein [Jannaschia sp. GRR-S6-38]WGH79203.1 DUF3859 domain-containing protein [Jannaschia sp. GRR-S6-38]